MKLTKLGYKAYEKTILDYEGVDEPYEISPYKKAIEFDKLIQERSICEKYGKKINTLYKLINNDTNI
jgi:hypothetical protein